MQKYHQQSSEQRELERLEEGIAALYKLPCFLPCIKLAKAVSTLLIAVPAVYHPWADQLYRAAVSVPANVAEAHGRNSLPQRLQYTSVARGSCWESLALLLCAPDAVDVEKLVTLAVDVVKLLDVLTLDYARQRAEAG